MDILKTRLYKPTVKPYYVLRQGIINYLEKNAANPLTIMVAAAGYGKSVTTSQWLDHKECKYGWLSLDDDCNEVGIFLNYLVNCVQSTYPDSLKSILEFSNSSVLPGANVISRILLNEISELDEEFTLVLDDYHLIHNEQVHLILNEVLKHPSEKLKLMILSRRDPPLRLSGLKAYHLVNEIRMSELRFDENETILLAKGLSLNSINPKTVKNLVTKTEGWVIGLRLALQSIQRGRSIEEVLSGLAKDRHLVNQFLMSEIIDQQAKQIRECLFKSSILSRFNKDLLMAVCLDDEQAESPASDDEQEGFETIINLTLFIVRLDADQKWFRFHHLFREILLNQLQIDCSGDQISLLHKKASKWLEKNKYWDEAYDHAIYSGDTELAVSIFDKNRIHFFNTDQLKRIDRWLNKLPVDTLEKHISLLVSRAVLDEAIRDAEAMKYHLSVAKKLADKLNGNSPENKQLLGEFHAVYCNLFFSFERKYVLALEHSNMALELLVDKTQYLFNYALVVHLMALNAVGKFAEAKQMLAHIEHSLEPDDEISLLYVSIVKSYLYSFRGDLNEIVFACKRSLPIINANKRWVLLSNVLSYLASSQYQLNNLHKAIEFADALKEHYYAGRTFWEIQSIYHKAFALQALGETEKLSETINMVDEFTLQNELPIFHELTKAFKVDLALRQGDIDRALELSKSTDFDSVYLDYTFYFQQLTYIRLLIITDLNGNSDKIERLIKKYDDIGRAGYKYNLLMQALLLRSVYLHKKGEKESAIAALKEALELSGRGGFLRIYVDQGEPVKQLLEDVHQSDPYNSYVSNLLDAFDKEEKRKYKTPILAKNDSHTVSPNETKILSFREIELLKLVSSGYQNKEIAEKLFLSPNSVKKYLYDIYQKLGVTNRTGAIIKAKDLSLF